MNSKCKNCPHIAYRRYSDYNSFRIIKELYCTKKNIIISKKYFNKDNNADWEYIKFKFNIERNI